MSIPVSQRTSGIAAEVFEIQGLYGPFSFPEKLLQKIWLRRDFDRRSARTTDGREVRVSYPGKWNLLGGPDFKGARLSFGGSEILGDVELHLQAGDWMAHGHPADVAYDGVVLHVVLFPPAPEFRTRAREGKIIPTLVLLPLLLHDLEEYAAAEAVENLANRPGLRAVEELSSRTNEELVTMILDFARQRWRQKTHFARMRIQRLGWNQACHYAALEILGYRFNRVAMLRIALRFPLSEWTENRIDLEVALESEKDAWSLQGVRPANHPRTRLRQYSAWLRARPDWIDRLPQIAAHRTGSVIDPRVETAEFRATHQLADARRHLRHEICADTISGTRFDNLVCDGFLPLIAAKTDTENVALWFHWFTGDQPAHISQSLRALGLIGGRKSPASHGIVQGFLGWLIEKDMRSSALPINARFRGGAGLDKI